MKFKYLLPAALLATALSSQAVPAWPGLLERTLEDGSKIMVRLNGDEYFSYLTDESGFLLTDTGSGLKYELQDNARVMATPELMSARREFVENSGPAKMMRANQMQRMAELTREGRTTFCTTGEVNFLVLLVQYDDIKFNSPTIRQDMDDMLNKEGYDLNGCKGSMRDYYITNSNGKFKPHFDVSEVITLPKTSKYYTGDNKYDNVQEMVKTAVELADPQVDFSKYCNVIPGEVDAVIIWYAGYGQADTSNTEYIWPHQSSIRNQNLSLDGVRITTYCCFNELNGGRHYYNKDGALAGMGTPIHEFGHIMGMPDLYDPNYKVNIVPGSWSIFCSGPYLGDGYVPPLCSGYERWMFNWIEYEEVEDGTHYELKDLHNQGKVIRIPVKVSGGSTYNNEYFLIETRTQEGWDSYLPGNGMLIWHIDYAKSAWTSNVVNSTLSRTRCGLVTADGSANYFLGNYNTASNKAAWPQEINYLTPDTDITLNTYYVLAESATGNSYITNMAYDRMTGTGSFDYNMITDTPNDVTVMSTPYRGQTSTGSPNNEIILSWEPVEGATDYQVSMWRVNSAGKVYYESGLEDYSVGNVTSYTVPALSTAKMSMEYHATVRVVKGIPSSELSNEVVFTPKELSSVGIDEVLGGDVAVIGLQGAILAPEGAEVYNMQGVRCGTTGLTPGIYVVRYGSSVSKVAVK